MPTDRYWHEESPMFCQHVQPHRHDGWEITWLDPAPSVRRAQIPAEARVAAQKAAYTACEDDRTNLVEWVDAALAAAAPVLLSEYQQRIEAGLADHVAQIDGPATGWRCICGWRPDFQHLQRFRWLVDHRSHVAAEIVAHRAALGSTKTGDPT